MNMPAFSFLPRRLPTACDAVLWLCACLHGLLLLSFLALLAFAPSARAEDAACRGHNLLTEMRDKDPATYRQILKDGEAIPNGKGLFWKIEKPGIETSYLLGTMHVTDPRVLALPRGAMAAKAGAKVIVIESDEILDEQKAMARLMTKPQLTMMMDGKTIQSFLSPADEAKLETALKERGIPLGAVSRMQPWMLSSFVALPACELARKAKGASFLDKQLAEDAISAGKPVKGLETMEEQLSAMASIPTEFHLKSLMEMLALGDKMDDVMVTMTDLYLSGDIGLTTPMLKAVSPDGADGEGYAEFEERVVTARNHTMAERARPLLDQGGVFMAVGALHLVGEEGLVSLLRADGFTVTAVN